MKLQSELDVSVPSMGRFGTSITSVADLNGDGLRDVAVGAPLEDDSRGSVYIYLGDGQKGIRSTFSQVGRTHLCLSFWSASYMTSNIWLKEFISCSLQLMNSQDVP